MVSGSSRLVAHMMITENLYDYYFKKKISQSLSPSTPITLLLN